MLLCSRFLKVSKCIINDTHKFCSKNLPPPPDTHTQAGKLLYPRAEVCGKALKISQIRFQTTAVRQILQ